MTTVHTILAPAPLPSQVRSEWCHTTIGFAVAYCGAVLPADEPHCGVRDVSRIGTCPGCGRPRCPDCVVEARRP